MAKENAVGWKAKKSGLNTIIGTPENPTEFESGQVIINKKSTKKNLDKLIEINNDGKKSNSPGKVTNDATEGGLLKGKPHYDKNGKATGGIPGIVDGGKMIETEGDEFVVNKEASEEHWKELSEINQADGNGVAINPPSGIDDDPQEYKEGGKIEFNPNKLPKKSILKYAEMIRTKYPEIWKLGGNIFGNQAFKNLKRVSERGYWEDSEEWMYIKWRSYVARHIHDFRIEGVIAMLKWVDTVEKGWPYMKQLIEEKIDKIESKKKGWKHKADKMKDGGNLNDEKHLTVTKYILNRHPNKGDIFKGGKVDGYKIVKIKKIKKSYGITFQILILDTKPNAVGQFNKRIVTYNPQDKKISDFLTSNLTSTKGIYYTPWDDSEMNEKMKEGGDTNNSNNKDENKKRTKKESIIEEAISYISRSVSAAKEKQPTGISEQKIKNLESQFAFDFAIKKGIWHGDLKNLPKPIGGGGNENSLYYDENTGIIYKSNNLFNSNFSILEYLNYLLYHNRLFPNTKYNFFGFTGFSNNYPSITSAIPFIEPIVTQKYILGESATQDQIENYMLKIGFEKINEHTFKKDSFIVSDLRPRNVIKDSEGDIFVIDNIIKPQSKMKDGGSVDNTSKSFVIFFKSKMSDEIIYVPIEDSSISLDEAIERQRNLYSWMDIKWIKGFEANKGTERLELFLQNMKDKWETNPDLSVKIKNGQIVFSKGRDSVAFDVAILFKIVSTSEKSLTMFNRAHMTNGNTEIIVDDNFNFDRDNIFELMLRKMKDGGSVAQTPAPKKDRIVGSDVNKPKSSSSAKSGSSIEFSKELTNTISDKVKEHNEAHPNNKITLASAKAVVRRGMGAYSSSHRPTITGGQPNSRTAWGLARLNAFTYKIIHGKSKSGKYTQDDDLIEELGYKVAKYHLGGDMSKHLAPNGKLSNLTHEQWHLVRTPEFKAWFGDWENNPANASKVVDENGEPLVMYHGTKSTDIEEFDLSKSKRKSSGLKEFAHFFTSNKELALLYREASEIKEDLLKSINAKINSLTDEQENVRNNRDWERIQNEIDLLRSYKRGKIYSLFLNVKKPFEFDAETKDIDGWNNARIDVGYDIKKGRTAVLEAVSGNNDAYNSPYDGLIAYNLADLHTSKQYKIENLSGTVAAIWNPNQIKLADGSNTTFDGNNPDIRFDDGGLIPEMGTLTTKDKKTKLDYKKVGNDFEFVVYDGKPNPNKNLMNYNQFVNYLYAEGYIDDKMNVGGSVDNNVELVSVDYLNSIRNQDKSMWNYDLEKSIEKEGVLEPVTIGYWPEYDKVTLLDGHHRLDTAIDLDIESVPAQIELYYYDPTRKHRLHPVPKYNLMAKKPSDLGIFKDGGSVDNIAQIKSEINKLYTKAFKMMPNSPRQKEILKQIDELRLKLDQMGGKFNDGGKIMENTEKLIQTLKQNSNIQYGVVSTTKDGEKYRYVSYRYKNPISPNWLVMLYQKAAAENGNWFDTTIFYKDYTFHYDRPTIKNMPNGSMGMKELEIIESKKHGGVVEFNKMIESEYLKTYQEDYDSIEKINSIVAMQYLQQIAIKNGFSVGEVEFVNESKNPKNHFQMLMNTYDVEKNKDIIIYTAPFVYVNDSHKVVQSKTKVELLNSDWETIKKDIRYKHGGSVDAKDTLTIDIPLMIRLLELSREDVHSDAELHMVVERLLDLKNKPVLTMDDYTYIAEIEHKHLKKKMDLGGNLETEKLIAKAHNNLTWKRGRKEYAPTTSEIQEEIDRMIMEQQFGSTNI